MRHFRKILTERNDLCACADNLCAQINSIGPNGLCVCVKQQQQQRANLLAIF